MSQFKEIAYQGLWKNNPGLVQLLGLCPLLAVSSTLTNALGLGVATLLVLLSSNIAISLVRHHVPNEIRIPVFVLIIIGFVTVLELTINAFAFGLYQSLGIFIPLIGTNCIIIGRAEAFASKNPVLPSAFDATMMGTGFTLVLVLLGGIREILGQGTLFDGAEQMFGSWAKGLRIEVFHSENHFLLAMLPPGAFLCMGMLIALRTVINNKLQQRQQTAQKTITRSRVTGTTQ
ncbi:electron transport complex subunit E [Chromatiaceae bacterium AAb-1]|nr:electron transport complex subunit E [Chromatiaceae bacterium AAb-1]